MTHPDSQNKAACLRPVRKVDLGLQQRRTFHMSASSELINGHASAQTDGYRVRDRGFNGVSGLTRRP
jgi:hypothetical protein